MLCVKRSSKNLSRHKSRYMAAFGISVHGTLNLTRVSKIWFEALGVGFRAYNFGCQGPYLKLGL